MIHIVAFANLLNLFQRCGDRLRLFEVITAYLKLVYQTSFNESLEINRKFRKHTPINLVPRWMIRCAMQEVAHSDEEIGSNHYASKVGAGVILSFNFAFYTKHDTTPFF